jgi:hypothetical protein
MRTSYPTIFFGQNAAETNCCAQEYKNSTGNIFSKRSRVHTWKLVAEDLSLLMPVHFIPGPILRMSFSVFSWQLCPYLALSFLWVSSNQFSGYYISRTAAPRTCMKVPQILPQPPYSPDLAPSDYHLFALQQSAQSFLQQ